MSKFIEDFGKNLREVRKARRLSQKQLADALQAVKVNVSAQTVSAWELGIRSANIEQLHALLDVLDAPPELLLGVRSPYTELDEFWTERKLHTVRYAATEWEGDKRALWEFIILFMSLPSKMRADVVGYCLHDFELAAGDNAINHHGPAPNKKLLEDAWITYTTK